MAIESAHEGTALFERREDAAQRLAGKGIWLKVGWPVSEDVKAFGNAYVRVRGTFEANTPGIAFKGTLVKITKIERWPAGSATPGGQVGDREGLARGPTKRIWTPPVKN
jgi:hypothetical protein